MRQFFLREYIKKVIRVFFLGIILGILIIFLFRNRLQTDIYVLNEEWMLSLQTKEVDSKVLFVYILFKRLKEMGVFLFLATTFVGIICMYGYIGMIGVGTGVLLAVSCLRYGLRGLVLVLLAAFPQCLFYLPAMLYVFHLGYMMCIKLYFPHKDYWKNNGSMKVFLFKNIIYIFLTIVVVIIGIILESYVNPQIIFSFIKKF